jgi:hypothetical protein
MVASVLVSLSVAWKLMFAIALGLAIFMSAFARAPRHSVPSSDLRRLVICALTLYGVGGVATLTHHAGLAGLVYAVGIAVAALAAWLSRGRDQEDPPGGGHEPVDEQPPPEPDGVPRLDWAKFEREFRDWADRTREPTARR